MLTAIVLTVLVIDIALLLYQQYLIWEDRR